MSSSSASYTTQIRFARALSVVRALPDRGALQPTAAEKLNLYGLYKQATQGDCNISRPSSKQMGRYAKWKAWERRRGVGPVEAQKMYVNALIELLVEFIHRYPDHEQAPSLSQSLHYIELSEDESNVEESFVDAWDPDDAEKEEYYLAHLGPHQLDERQLDLSSPEQRYHNHLLDTPSLATFPSSTNNSTFPETPELSPHYSQQNQKYWHRNNSKYARPIDFLAHGANSSVTSDTDTMDREVAAATASLALSSPNYHPYTPATNGSSTRKQSVDKTNNSTVTPSAAAAAAKSSSSTTAASNDGSSNKKQRVGDVSERALESLQTEVTALSEQIDRLTRGMVERDERQRQMRWSWMRLIKSIAKHTLINSLVLLLVFMVLWRRKSPVALAIVGYVGPQAQEIMRYLVRRIVFWKVTV
ncbi:acyl CoA binding protein-domain-containing protein [Zychaea mexicana]|uniref:acyl CoA binding protein-domain-containing protein n=1 Tax=Zychaea mexicana TaxID=64656 RepID=UPI0022FEFDA8|nr:acyl CoA binding protein-domain-containing protein [Zychaea mexicana]KAI9498562.1 acyl CoA binding protein-domain-containing protein [Zychaea mexicana]